MPHELCRETSRELQSWIQQLKTESDRCISEILDAVEPADGPFDAATQLRSVASIDRIAERIIDVMSAYDSLLESLGDREYFADCISRLHAD